ncbi:MAG TPA: hypothetical protein V6D22_05350 [Candidatus Obscuribacterales bacterium]
MNSFRLSAVRGASFATAVALSQLLWLAPMAVQAADDSVRLAGQVVFTANGAGGMSADQRAEAIQRNLDNALVAAQDRSPSAINIVYVKGVPVITLGGYQVVTINASDAKEAGTTPAILAQRWADSLRNSLQDQGSVSSYVNQLNGGYQSNAPTTAPNPPANTAQYNPPPPDQGGPGAQGGPGGPGGPGGQFQGAANYDQFGRMTAPPQQGYQGGAYGNGPGGYPPQNGYAGGGYGMQRGRVVYAPAGLTMPASLRTSISTQAAQPGDVIEAGITDMVNLEGGSLPPGTVLVGQVVSAKAGGFLGRSGMLEVKFNRMRTPDGQETPISAHIVGGIGKYALSGGDTMHGETWKNKVGQAALRGAIGAGTGAALGTAVGAIAGRSGRATGRGAWSGTAIGGGLGVADSLLLRKGRDVTIKSGTNMQVQLDSPATIGAAPGGPYGAVGGQPPYGNGY